LIGMEFLQLLVVMRMQGMQILHVSRWASHCVTAAHTHQTLMYEFVKERECECLRLRYLVFFNIRTKLFDLTNKVLPLCVNILTVQYCTT